MFFKIKIKKKFRFVCERRKEGWGGRGSGRETDLSFDFGGENFGFFVWEISLIWSSFSRVKSIVGEKT